MTDYRYDLKVHDQDNWLASECVGTGYAFESLTSYAIHRICERLKSAPTLTENCTLTITVKYANVFPAEPLRVFKRTAPPSAISQFLEAVDTAIKTYKFSMTTVENSWRSFVVDNPAYITDADVVEVCCPNCNHLFKSLNNGQFFRKRPMRKR